MSRIVQKGCDLGMSYLDQFSKSQFFTKVKLNRSIKLESRCKTSLTIKAENLLLQISLTEDTTGEVSLAEVVLCDSLAS